jgi:hypothetical protein
MLLTILFLSLLCIGFAWQCWRDLAQIRRELDRHQRGQAIRARVLAAAAKLRMEVQP